LENFLMSSLMTIYVNGVSMTINNTIMVSDFVQQQSITGKYITAINDVIVPESARASTPLNDDDRLDIMSPISGG